MTTVFIISAPSGSGKSTLVSELMRLVPRLRFSVSYTTRYPRGDERDGVDGEDRDQQVSSSHEGEAMVAHAFRRML